MLKRGGYRADFRHRFGLIGPLPPKSPSTARIWIQAVSVGELLALRPLIEELRATGGLEIVLTTTTSTGYRLALDRYRSETVAVGYFPLDWMPFSATAWNRIAPDLAVLMESELWPEHLYQAHRRGVPLVLVNARISDRSLRRYRRVPSLARRLLAPFRAILAASEHDAARFRALGSPKGTVQVIGNLKIDAAAAPALSPNQLETLKSELGFHSPPPTTVRSNTAPPTLPFLLSLPLPLLPLILLGASTWPGEEDALLDTLAAALQEKLDCRLLLVPRHAERRTEIRASLRRRNLSFHFRSESAKAPSPVAVCVADTTGELAALAQTADLVFVGKSLPPHSGGQNPIEAAALGKPLLFGPGMANFREIAVELLACGAACTVSSREDLARNCLRLIHSREDRQAMSKAALRWHAANQGASTRACIEISRCLPPHFLST